MATLPPCTCRDTGSPFSFESRLQSLVELSFKIRLVSLSVRIANFRSLVTGHSHRFSRAGSNFLVSEGSVNFQFSSWERGSHVYRHGIAKRLDDIACGYSLDSVPWPQIETVLDIGANYGDFSAAVMNYRPFAKIVAAEPVPWDAENLRLRLPSATIETCAVSNVSGETLLWLEEAGGDSSLYPKDKDQGTAISVIAVTLGDLIAKHGEFDLIKIEAEGGEPEIISGSLRALRAAKYVIVDGGPERGPGQDSTIEECLSLLLGIGFRLIDFSKSRPTTALLRNSAELGHTPKLS